MSDAFLRRCKLSKWAGNPRRCRWCNQPLTGRRRRWCKDLCAERAGRNHWWTAAREAALKRDGHKCVHCGSARRVQVHHRDVKAKGRHGRTHCCHHVRGLVSLCRRCHLAEHRR